MVSRMGQGEKLLDTLREIVDCPNLSDLWLLDDREPIRQALRQFGPENYIHTGWRDAACYLLTSKRHLALC